MFVKIFDENHEEDLEDAVNDFINNDGIKVIDIKFKVAIMYDNKDQIYCYTAMIIYDIEE